MKNAHKSISFLIAFCMILLPLQTAEAGWRNYVRSWWQTLHNQTNEQTIEVREEDTVADQSEEELDEQTTVVVVPIPVVTEPVSEPSLSYTGYNDGNYTVTVPYPGVHEHGARRNADGVSGTGTLRYDPLPPNIGVASMRISARHNTPVQIPFHDRCSSGCGDYTGLELSGVTSALVTITGPTGTGSYAGSSTVTVNHDFSQTGYYDLDWSATDNAGNSNTGTLPNFIRVVAGAVEWDADNCVSNHETSCPSSITTTANESRVSDGSDTHVVDLKLVDRYGNRVKSVDGVKDVAVNFLFNNTADLNQIAGSGDAARFKIDEFNYDETGADTGSAKLIETGYHSEAAGGDGEIQMTVHSYSPTSIAYTPIASDGFDLALTGVAYRITALGGDAEVTEEDSTKNVSGEVFPFIPTLTATPDALNYNTASGSYEATASALRNITVNTAKRFNLDLENQSDAEDASAVRIGLVMDPSDDDISWRSSGIETAGATALAAVHNIQAGIDDNNPLTAGTWTAVPAAASTIAQGSSVDMRMRSTPQLAAAASTAPNFGTYFLTHVNYEVGGRNSRHKSERLALGSGDDADVFNVNIQIIGTTRSEAGINSNLDNDKPATNLGDVFLSEVKTDIDRNAAFFVQGTAASRACTSDTLISSSNDWETLPCLFSNGSIAYFKNADVILDGSSNGIVLPTGARTIIVHGGNISIRDNLIAADNNNNSFGMIALRNDNNDSNPLNDGGNVYLAPQVTNVFGALYAEGSLVSTNHGNAITEYTGTNCPSDGSGGFCDRATELHDQLLWQGLIISQNTIGGSDKVTPECPSYLGGICDSRRDLARIFDFNYLRTYHAAAGGNRAGGMQDDGTDTDVELPNTPGNETNDHAVVVEYIGSIKSNPPPLFGNTGDASTGEVGY